VILLVALLVIAAIVVVILLASGGDDSKSNSKVEGRLVSAPTEIGDGRLVRAGIISGKPGYGSAALVLEFDGDAADLARKKLPMKGTLVANYDAGSFTASFKGTSKPGAGGTLTLDGNGRITDGTGDLDGATGSISYSGTNAEAGPASVQDAAVGGSIEF
jgi:hypothetical protein